MIAFKRTVGAVEEGDEEQEEEEEEDDDEYEKEGDKGKGGSGSVDTPSYVAGGKLLSTLHESGACDAGEVMRADGSSGREADDVVVGAADGAAGADVGCQAGARQMLSTMGDTTGTSQGGDAARADGCKDQGAEGKEPGGVLVCAADFMHALHALTPSLSLDELAKYERLRDQYESRDAPRPAIAAAPDTTR
jgi:hypothetical protein